LADVNLLAASATQQSDMKHRASQRGLYMATVQTDHHIASFSEASDSELQLHGQETIVSH